MITPSHSDEHKPPKFDYMYENMENTHQSQRAVIGILGHREEFSPKNNLSDMLMSPRALGFVDCGLDFMTGAFSGEPSDDYLY